MLLSCHASRFPAAPQSWLWQGKLEEAIGQWRDAKAQKEVPSCCALPGLWQGSGFCGMAAVARLLWLMHAVYNRRVLTVRWGQVKGSNCRISCPPRQLDAFCESPLLIAGLC